MSESWYPELAQGTEVIWAPRPDAVESRWMLGRVAVVKNLSCDIALVNGGYMFDCIHIQDPRCQNSKQWAATGRGIFKLAPSEVQRREWFENRLPALEAKLRYIEEQLEDLAITIAARPAVASPSDGGPADSATPSSPPRRQYSRRKTVKLGN